MCPSTLSTSRPCDNNSYDCNDNDCDETTFSPFLSDELDKTDKVSHLHKLRKSLSRSVSFVMKSLGRSNPNLSQSSLHSTGSSCHDSFMSLEESVAKDMNLSDSNLTLSLHDSTSIRSCFKGSQRGRCDKKFVVRFLRRTKEHKIEPYFEYAADLWYTTLKEKKAFLFPQFESTREKMQAVVFMEAYVEAKKQVYPKEWYVMKEPKPSTAASCCNKLLVTSYNAIVLGKKYGLAGFEQYNGCIKKRRRVHVQAVVLQICAAYHECKVNYNNTSISISDTNMVLLQDAKAYTVISECLRKYAKGLTKVDRYWSTAMGQADYDAACDMYDSNRTSCKLDDDDHHYDCVTNHHTEILNSKIHAATDAI
jgi:hypothetical protein